MRHNVWVRDWVQQNGFPVLDIYATLVDPATGGYRSGYGVGAGDTIHFTEQAAYDISTALLADGVPWPFRSEFSFGRATSDPSNLFYNGLNLIDTNSDGRPDGWSASTPLASTIIADATINGNWYCFTTTDVSSGFIQRAISTGFSAGDLVQFMARLETEGGGSSNTTEGLRIVLQFQGSGIQENVVNFAHMSIIKGVFSWERIIPSGTTGINLRFHYDSVSGIATRVAEVTARNLTVIRA